ncbi:MAG: trypsin-like peptidase domain-containing protein [Actinomycetota bacterium]
MKKILSIPAGAAAGFAGAALFFLIAFALHWGGLGEDPGTVTVPMPSVQVSNASSAPVTAIGAEQIYERFADSVVQMVVTFEGQGSSLYSRNREQQGVGSGFVVSPEGYIITNAHVVTSEGYRSPSEAKDIEVNFKNGKKVKGSVVGYDLTSSDIAVVKVDPEGLDLVPVVIGDSDAVKVGEPVVAIGSPFGVFASSLSAGVVSATNRTVESPEAGFSIQNAIQTDAAINRGNSGGPLFNQRGEVIGINEQIASTSGGSEGVGFAVPINTAKGAMEQIIATGAVEYAWIGIVGQTVKKETAGELGVTAE